MQDFSDQELITLIKSVKSKDNDLAFKHLYKTFYTPIENFVRANKGDIQEAEDIFQDSLIVLFHQIKKNKLELTCSLKTYIYSISRNLWLKKLRKSKKIVGLSDTLKAYITIEESSLKTLEATEQKKMIASFLDQLKGDCKQVLTYFYFEKLKMTEIAYRMSYASEHVAKNKKFSCMKKLKTLIKDSKYFNK